MTSIHEREDTPAATATPTQARLAREHAERMKRWQSVKEPIAAPRLPAPEPEVVEPPPKPAPEPAKAVPIEPQPPAGWISLPEWIDRWRGTRVPFMPHTPSWSQIQRVTAEHFNLTRQQMLGRSREQRYVRARQVGMVLCLEMVANASLSQVGRWFGNRDHTTVMHARDTVKELLVTDPKLAYAVERIRQALART